MAPPRLKEVVYTLSPFNQNVMTQMFKNIPEAAHRKIKENWIDAGFFAIGPVVATIWYANSYLEKEKLHHRF